MKRALVVAAFLAITIQGLADVRPLKGPPGGDITAVAIAGGRVFASTGTGLWISSSAGAAWNRCANGLPLWPVMSITVGADSTIYALSINIDSGAPLDGELYRSENRGESWSACPRPAEGRGRSVACLGSWIFMSCWNKGVFCSKDHGASWERRSVGLPDSGGDISMNHWFNDLALAVVRGKGSDTSVSLFASAIVYTPGIRWHPRIYRSDDSGMSWRVIADSALQPFNWDVVNATSVRLPISAPGLFSANGNLFAYYYGYPSSVADTTRCIYRSTDKGVSWQSTFRGLTHPYAYDFASCNDTLYCATTGGVFRSSDDGANWEQSDTGIRFTSIMRVAAAPGLVVAGGGSQWNYHVGDDDFVNGIWVSHDGAARWLPSNTGMYDGRVNNIIAVGSEAYVATYSTGIFRVGEGGAEWTQVSAWQRAFQGSMQLVRCPQEGGGYRLLNAAILFGGGSPTDCLCWKLNAGDSIWQRADSGLPAQWAIAQLFVDTVGPAGAPRVVLAGVYGNGIYRSEDDGDTWQHAKADSDNVYAWQFAALPSMDSHPAEALFFGGNAGLFESRDRGRSWFPVSNIVLKSAWIYGLCTRADRLYVLTREGVYSTRDGFAWRLEEQSARDTTLEGLVTVGRCVVGYGARRIVVLDTMRHAWIPLADTVPGDRIYSVTLVDSDVWVGTQNSIPMWTDYTGESGFGVWAFPYSEIDTLALSSIDERGRAAEISACDLQIYPNPATRTAHVLARLPHAGNVALIAVDVAGRNIGTVYAGYSESSFATAVSLDAVPAGAYQLLLCLDGKQLAQEMLLQQR